MKNEAKQVVPPSHIIWQVVGEKENSKWIRVGAGWTNKDGKGLFLKFDAYPMVGRIQVREVTNPENASADAA